MENYSILVVDDSQDNLKTISSFLKETELSLTILKAPNGKIACTLAEKKLPDLIILDWEMPEMDGIETLKCLKRFETTADIPVIMCTGKMTTSEHLKTALEAGAVDYIRKPIDKTELSARVYSMLKLSESYKEIKLLNATKDKFFSIIAHDLKSPFTALLGFSNLLLESHATIDDEERETYIKFINDGSIKTFKLLENLLTWAQSQSGRIEFTPEKINIETLINEIILLLTETAENKEIKLIANTDNSLFVNADKNMIDTVIRNLISNAIKFTPKGGDITIKSHTITDNNNQKFAEISVKDSGVGIPPEIQSKLFKITENISTKGTEEEAGTGLGLILCKEFVEKHGGKIWVESEVKKGSKFIFTIPQIS
ncbi:MAG: hybrid sensor histidine kinase/response regulator [Bacteroidales bacterium]|nr:hybrid sensor histidine kinase/response regulator [Bacteroidales bacterium]